jgi:hypothetical protein
MAVPVAAYEYGEFDNLWNQISHHVDKLVEVVPDVYSKYYALPRAAREHVICNIINVCRKPETKELLRNNDLEGLSKMWGNPLVEVMFNSTAANVCEDARDKMCILCSRFN